MMLGLFVLLGYMGMVLNLWLVKYHAFSREKKGRGPVIASNQPIQSMNLPQNISLVGLSIDLSSGITPRSYQGYRRVNMESGRGQFRLKVLEIAEFIPTSSYFKFFQGACWEFGLVGRLWLLPLNISSMALERLTNARADSYYFKWLMDEAPGINTRPSLMFPFSKIPIIETPNLKKCNFFSKI